MANIAAQRIKREFKEVIKSEEVSFAFFFSTKKNIKYNQLPHHQCNYHQVYY